VSARREVPAGPIALASDSSVTAFDRVRAHSPPARGVNSVGSDRSKSREQPEADRHPGSAFTIVLGKETLPDVARRIYGSGELADSLWRANRDALSRRDSPLSAGMVLRTPVLISQSPLRK
jgi:hypothetical protein